MNKTAFVTTTSTNANKGSEALRRYGIKSEIRKFQGGTASGCLYGITVDGNAFKNAEKILLDADVRIISVKDVPK